MTQASDINACIENIEGHYYANKYLSLRECDIEDKDIPAINSFMQSHEVEDLDLGSNKITNIGATELATNNNIKGLMLYNNNIDDEGVVELAKNANLNWLFLENNPIGDKGLIALAQNKTISVLGVGPGHFGLESASALANNTTLKELELFKETFDHLSFTELAKNTSLTGLMLTVQDVSTEDLQEFAKMTSLTFLGVFGSNRGNEVAKVIRTYPNLKVLYLGSTNLSDQGLIELAMMPKLESMSLQNDEDLVPHPKNKFSTKALETFIINSPITDLGLSNYGIDDESAAVLASSHILESLFLNGNNIGDEGAASLARSSTLKHLSLYQNNIGDAGAIALSQNTVLDWLNVIDNHIGKAGLEALKASSIPDIWMDGNDEELTTSMPKKRRLNALCQSSKAPIAFCAALKERM